jgi:arylsulfatase A-like enzyme
MADIKNILFIMCDQLRADYLSCAGHPTLETPNIDALAARGVKFDRAYTQSPVCGPSRMSFYTGRYVISHGATWNGVPLDVAEWTIGDYLRPLGKRCVLVGKTHMAADDEGMARLEVDKATDLGVLVSQCGFEPFERDDGLIPYGAVAPNLAYNKWLNEQGYPGDNPWHDYANSAEGPDGDILTGWQMRYARKPARVKAEHSETPYMTSRAMEFMDDAGDDAWCLHLSFIKPHWPYVAPAPYNDMYGPNQIVPANKSPAEREHPHPVVAAYMKHDESQTFQNDETRSTVIPVYMGLIKQIDDELGRLFSYMDDKGLSDNTMIVFTSDHGDYLGDHWLGEKELFHEPSSRIPMIIVDPSKAADATRGTSSDALVEAIDLVPTFIEACGGEIRQQRLEGRSLMPLLQDNTPPDDWREAVFSELDYGFRGARNSLEREPGASLAWMVRTDRWKYVYYDGFPPQLFDLENDPEEQHDLGTSAQHATIREEKQDRLFTWLRRRRLRRTMSDDDVVARTDMSQKRGFRIGEW